MHVVVTGGTSGIGRALVHHLARHGHHVTAIGRDAARGAALRKAGNVRFLRADLSLVSENERVAAEIAHADLLVLCAAAVHAKRGETPEGFERTFALNYLSRYVLSHRIAAPLTVNVAGPGAPVGSVTWDDLQLRDGYGLTRAAMQASRANDLLGASLADRDGTRYVLYNPGAVDTGMHRQLPAPWRQLTGPLFRLFAASPERAARRLAALLDDLPSEGLSAYRVTRRIDTRSGTFAKHFDPAAAARLRRATAELVPSGT